MAYIRNQDGSITYFNGMSDKNSGNIVWSPSQQGAWNRNVGSYTVPWNRNTYGRSTETSSPATETKTTNTAQPTEETTSSKKPSSRTYTSRMNVGVQRPYTTAMRDKAREYGLTDANTVKRLQTWLYNNGQYTKPYTNVESAADGIYGSNTNDAVLKWLSANQDKSFTDLMNLVNGVKSETPSNSVTSEPTSTIASQYNWNQSAPEYRLDSFTPRGNLSHYYGDNTFVGYFNKQQGMNMRRLGQNYIDRNGVTHNMGEMRNGQIRRLARRERRADINVLNNLQAYNEMANLPNYGESTQPAQSNNQVQVNPTTGISTQFDSLMNNYYKTRGYQQGGKMNDKQLQEAFIQFLAQKSGAKNEKELEAYVKQLGENGLKQAYAEFTEVMQKQTQKAKQGAKLNYIKQLKHQCPDGQELVYYKEGGLVKCGCAGKKMEKGGEAPKQSAVEKFKARKMANGDKVIDKRKQYIEDMKKAKDQAEKDSIAANKYNDQDVQTSKPGKYINGKWTPDRTKAPYNKKKITVSACGSKMKKK